jgi:hypothetical protein
VKILKLDEFGDFDRLCVWEFFGRVQKLRKRGQCTRNCEIWKEQKGKLIIFDQIFVEIKGEVL